MDVRLAALLEERNRTSASIRITHQEVAAELGTSREVIGHILEDFSAEGIVSVSRGMVEVLDPEALKKDLRV